MKMMTLYKQIIIKNTKMHLLAQFQGGFIVFLEIIGQKTGPRGWIMESFGIERPFSVRRHLLWHDYWWIGQCLYLCYAGVTTNINCFIILKISKGHFEATISQDMSSLKTPTWRHLRIFKFILNVLFGPTEHVHINKISFQEKILKFSSCKGCVT